MNQFIKNVDLGPEKESLMSYCLRSSQACHVSIVRCKSLAEISTALRRLKVKILAGAVEIKSLYGEVTFPAIAQVNACSSEGTSLVRACEHLTDSQYDHVSELFRFSSSPGPTPAPRIFIVQSLKLTHIGDSPDIAPASIQHTANRGAALIVRLWP
ncbi:unnamed protein product [Albugo candida]|uniref:Uncharacterized protein n=1 Tax=Albugo candida TaxID=65357 RepID=A0A024GI71_9STRA|nr:unnamed protein product [Albugo candida]|eukprot:CCI46386.1 unnamed protein product [Albugo candida]